MCYLSANTLSLNCKSSTYLLISSDYDFYDSFIPLSAFANFTNLWVKVEGFEHSINKLSFSFPIVMIRSEAGWWLIKNNEYHFVLVLPAVTKF